MRAGGTARRLLLLAAAGLLAGAAAASGAIRLREVAHAWGVDFRHHHGGSGERYMVETMVGGLVALDYDDDGDTDLFFVDGAALPGYQGETPRSRLYRNDGAGRFVDVTERAGIEVAGYGCGGVAADYDGDGDLDLYVTAFGLNRLLRNEGDGTFREVGEAAGVADALWSAAATFADVDRDGDLDLYVSNYVDFTLATHKFCGDKARGIQGYCHPGAYQGLPDHFYRNRGDGTFEDATAAAGFSGATEAGLGAMFGDLDDDGWPDLYVANDADPNFLFHNRGNGTFEDVSLLSGTSYSTSGSPEAGMGVDFGDVDGNGLLDIVVTNFELETNALYQNLGGGIFVDARFASGLAEPSLLDLAFGVAFADLDQDGDLDLVIADGHILDNAAEFAESSRYAQADRVMENVGGGRFRVVEQSELGPDRVGRGLVAADLDGDGDLDFAINNSNQPASVYENLEGADAGRWLKVDLEGGQANRFGVGARVELEAGGGRQVREVHAGSSYLSQGDLTLHFGVGEAARAGGLTVRWPSGKRQRFAGLATDRRWRFYERGLAGGGVEVVGGAAVAAAAPHAVDQGGQ